jgi:hypothetical protein
MNLDLKFQYAIWQLRGLFLLSVLNPGALRWLEAVGGKRGAVGVYGAASLVTMAVWAATWFTGVKLCVLRWVL